MPYDVAMTDTTPLLLYIHGFNSSSQSAKALQLKRGLVQQPFACELWAPDLSHWPAEAVRIMFARLREELERRPLCIIGSSLGGYYATWLRQRLLAERQSSQPIKMVLINPAVRPFEYWQEYLGEQIHYHTGERYQLTQDHVRQLALLDVGDISEPQDCWLMVQRGDQTLDYRLAVTRYAESPQRVEEGGSHGFEGFEGALPDIYRFFNLA